MVAVALELTLLAVTKLPKGSRVVRIIHNVATKKNLFTQVIPPKLY